MELLPVALQNAAAAALVVDVVRWWMAEPNQRVKTWALEQGTAERVWWCVVCGVWWCETVAQRYLDSAERRPCLPHSTDKIQGPLLTGHNLRGVAEEWLGRFRNRQHLAGCVPNWFLG